MDNKETVMHSTYTYTDADILALQELTSILISRSRSDLMIDAYFISIMYNDVKVVILLNDGASGEVRMSFRRSECKTVAEFVLQVTSAMLDIPSTPC